MFKFGVVVGACVRLERVLVSVQGNARELTLIALGFPASRWLVVVVVVVVYVAFEPTIVQSSVLASERWSREVCVCVCVS